MRNLKESRSSQTTEDKISGLVMIINQDPVINGPGEI